ncbi:unnamed protein product [Sphagnum balticum]
MAGIGGLVGGSALDDELKRSNVVRLRGLPFSASEADIADFFKGLEKGPDGVVVCVNFQGRSTGQAYVQFATAELANKALDRNRQHIGSRYIEVFKGHPADMQVCVWSLQGGTMFSLQDASYGRYVELFRSTKGEMMTAVQQRMYGMFSGVGGFTQFGAVSQIPGMMGAFGVQGLTGMNLAAMQAAGLGGITGLPGLTDTSEHVCIKMRGLPYNATQREIMDFFDGLNIMPNGIHIVMGATDRPTGEAFVEFTSSDEAQRGMERHRQNIGSRYIELFRATKRQQLVHLE